MKSPRSSPGLRTSCAADPYLSLAPTIGLGIGPALPIRWCCSGHAGCAWLVVFERGLHEHHQRRALSRGALLASRMIRRFGLSRNGPLGNTGLPAVADAVAQHSEILSG